MRKRKAMSCINCPACSTYNGRSSLSDSEQICRKCGGTIVVQVKDGKLTIFMGRRKTDRRSSFEAKKQKSLQLNN